MLRRGWRVLACAVVLVVGRVWGDDDVSDLIGGATVATTGPAEVAGPRADLPDALGTMKAKAPAGARAGEIVLNNGETVSGEIWTTLGTPLRVWVEARKSYVDVDLGEVSRIEVKVVHEGMEDDWRWLKEGSDQKVYSGKKYPLVELEYVFTLVNGQTVAGGVVAPIYIVENGTGKRRALALYKKYKGKLDETLKDVAYIRTVELKGGGVGTEAGRERKLPLIY